MKNILVTVVLLLASFNVFAERFTRITIKTADGPQDITLLSEEEAQNAFDYVAHIKRIPFKYVDDGCWARAQRMAYRLGLKDVKVGKLFIVGKLQPRPDLGWVYHVAPFILVGTVDHYEKRVIDPSLFEKPVTVEEWVQVTHPKNKYQLYFRSRGAFYADDYYRPHISIAERIETGHYLRLYRRLLKSE